jgi:hypothetical protein
MEIFIVNIIQGRICYYLDTEPFSKQKSQAPLKATQPTILKILHTVPPTDARILLFKFIFSPHIYFSPSNLM